jgi:hypothetical protein
MNLKKLNWSILPVAAICVILFANACSINKTVISTATTTNPPTTTPLNTSRIIEPYTVYGGMVGGYIENLYTIANWSGSGNKTMSFTSDETPMVLDFGYTPTSNIESSMDVSYQGGNNGAVLGSQGWYELLRNGTPIEGTGSFNISVISSGCNWWVKIGVEH